MANGRLDCGIELAYARARRTDMRWLVTATAAATTLTVTMTAASPSHAQQATRDVVTYEENVPNRGLIVSGAVLLGATYSVSTLVGFTSSEPADRALLVPVAGPWMDLADRPGCSDNNQGCNGETAARVLLVADGVGQALGALNMVGGFVFPAKRIVTKVGKVQILPQAGANGTGIMAYGAF
jgi:hypothetical protein